MADNPREFDRRQAANDAAHRLAAAFTQYTHRPPTGATINTGLQRI